MIKRTLINEQAQGVYLAADEIMTTKSIAEMIAEKLDLSNGIGSFDPQQSPTLWSFLPCR